MTDRQFIQRLVDELESREWTFIDGIPEHFECCSCNGGGVEQGNQPKHADDCTCVEVIKEAEAYLEKNETASVGWCDWCSKLSKVSRELIASGKEYCSRCGKCGNLRLPRHLVDASPISKHLTRR